MSNFGHTNHRNYYPIARPATSKQVDFLNRLLKEKDTTGLEIDLSDLTITTASSLIDELLKRGRAKAGTTSRRLPPVEGIHRWKGDIYKVQIAVHGSGNLYAKKLVEIHEGRCPGHLRENDPSAFDAPWRYHQHAGECDQWVAGEWGFEYAPGMVSHLTADTLMTLEEAKDFGALYGVCCVCGRTLTNEESIEAGIGPVCGRRLRGQARVALDDLATREESDQSEDISVAH